MSAIYRAYDTVMGREVAIKRLLPIEETKLNESDVAAISREAAALARLQHPNIISIYALEEDAEGPYFVMELVTGQDLHEIIREGALSWADFRDVAPQCLDPLVVAGELNLLHRDIKPGNIMLTRTTSGRFVVKLLDFGLAKFSQQPSLQTLDQRGSFLGSIDFIAPEQLELLPLDQRTDLYSLGCVYYYMLTQKSPFSGENPAVTSMNHIRHRCRPIGEIRPDLPEEIAAWIMRLISREPDDRPANAIEALRQWNDALFGRPFQPVVRVVPESDDDLFPLTDPLPRVDRTPSSPVAATTPKPRNLFTVSLPSKPAPVRVTEGARKTTGVEGLSRRITDLWRKMPPTGKWILLASITVVLAVETGRLVLRKRQESREDGRGPRAATELKPISGPLSPLPMPEKFAELDRSTALPDLPVRSGIFARFSGAQEALARDYVSASQPSGQVAAWVNLDDPRPVRSLLHDPGDPEGRNLPFLVVRDASNLLGLRGEQRGLTTTNRTSLVSPRNSESFEAGATIFLVARIEAGDDRLYRIQSPVWDGRFVQLSGGLDGRISVISKGKADGAESRCTIFWPGGELGLFVHRWDPVGGQQSLSAVAATSPNVPYRADASLEFAGAPLSQIGIGRRGFNDRHETFTGNVTFELIFYDRVLEDSEVESVSKHLRERYFSWDR